MKYEELTNLSDALENARFVCTVEHDDVTDSTSLLAFLETQCDPYYNYILCVYSDNMDVLPIYVGYTADLANRLNTHAQRVAFDVAILYHAAGKEIALRNEQRLMDLLGTRALFNGSLTQMPHVSRAQILEAIDAQDRPLDRVKKYTEADIIRKTYYINPTLFEALRMYAYEHHTEVSETVRICLVTGIPEAYLDAAYAKVHTSRPATA